MQHKLIGILSLLFASFLFAVPASAVDLPQCAHAVGNPPVFPGETIVTHFALVAQDNLIFEPQAANSGRVINGNVLVTSLHPGPRPGGVPCISGPGCGNFSNTGIGFVKVGSNTTIRGTVFADVLLLPDAGAPGSITHCVTNRLVGTNPAICGTVETFATFNASNPTCAAGPVFGDDPFTFSALCGPTPTIQQCANAASPLSVPDNATLTLGPADAHCFGDLVIGKNAVLTLGDGVAPQATWAFKSVNMKDGSRLIGDPGATVNVNGAFNTSGGNIITNIDLNVAAATSAEIVQIFNNSILTNVVINAPFGKCHLHTGTDLASCSEACCKVLDVEPITAECIPPPGSFFCACDPGFKFLNPWQRNPNLDPGALVTGTLQDSRTCVPCGPNDHPPAFPTCLP